MVEVEVTHAAPHHLVADGPLLSHRRTAAGDRFGTDRSPTVTALGLPSLGRPAGPDVKVAADSCAGGI
jgi:tRNA-2-methylthio-N6-dimethylallyladenosine synthase